MKYQLGLKLLCIGVLMMVSSHSFSAEDGDGGTGHRRSSRVVALEKEAAAALEEKKKAVAMPAPKKKVKKATKAPSKSVSGAGRKRSRKSDDSDREEKVAAAAKPKAKSRAKKSRESIEEGTIVLQKGKGGVGTGAGEGGFFWRILNEGVTAGKVYINMVDEPPVGLHPSIQIYLNKASQGRGIGRIGYRLACEASGYDKIYAHMRKSNLASQRAAEHAGFTISPIAHKQRLMEWVKKALRK